MVVLVVAAEAFELSGILKRAEHVERPSWPVRFARTASLNGMRLHLVANGPGPKLARRAAEAAPREAGAIVSTGLCGGLKPGLRIGDIFAADSVNGAPVSLPKSGRTFHTGPLLSQDRVARTAAEKRVLHERGFDAVEMESAALDAFAREQGLPFFCVRAISDCAGESFRLDFNRCRDGEGRFQPGKILAQAARKPIQGAAELWRLRRNAARAAEELGVFFADCGF